MSNFLTCNNVVSDSATIGDYLIEWRWGSEIGPVVFKSGVGSDTEIQAQHPFQNEVVLAGELYPVLQYIFINSDKYTLNYESGARYSPDLLTCLAPPPILIDPIVCGQSNYLGTYDYRLVREVNTGEKSRELMYQIGTTTKYLAWAFDTVNIPDKIEVFYCTPNNLEGELIDSMIVGVGITANYAPSNYPRQPGFNSSLPVTPIVVAPLFSAPTTGVIPYVSDLRPFTYEVGNFIRIKITGNVYNPERDDTKWTVYLKCLDDIPQVADYTDVSTIVDGTISFTWNDDYCGYNLLYNTVDQISTIMAISHPDNLKYFMKNFSIGNGQINTENGGSGTLGFSTSINAYAQYNFGCKVLVGQMTATKETTGVRLSFTSSVEYNEVVEDIASATGHSHYNNCITANDQQVEYYSHYNIQGFSSGTSCDNIGSYVSWPISIFCTITYDAINKEIFFAFPETPIVNALSIPSNSCDTTYTSVDAFVNGFNELIAKENGILFTASVGHTNLLGYRLLFITEGVNESRYFEHFVRIPKIMMNNIFDLTDYGFIETTQAGYPEYRIYQIKDRVEITDMSTHTSRLNSWVLSRDKWFNTRVQGDFGTYEVIAQAV